MKWSRSDLSTVMSVIDLPDSGYPPPLQFRRGSFYLEREENVRWNIIERHRHFSHFHFIYQNVLIGTQSNLSKESKPHARPVHIRLGRVRFCALILYFVKK